MTEQLDSRTWWQKHGTNVKFITFCIVMLSVISFSVWTAQMQGDQNKLDTYIGWCKLTGNEKDISAREFELLVREELLNYNVNK